MPRAPKPTGVKLDEFGNLARFQVDAHRVVDLDEGVGVTDGAGVVGHQVGDPLGADEDLPHLAQLVLRRRKGGVTKRFGGDGPPAGLLPWPPRR